MLIRTFGTNFRETVIEIHTFSFKKKHLKMSSGKWRPFFLGLNVLMHWRHCSVALNHKYTLWKMHMILLRSVWLWFHYQFIVNLHDIFLFILQGYLNSSGAIVWFPQCQWSNPWSIWANQQLPHHIEKKYNKVQTVCIILGVHCTS